MPKQIVQITTNALALGGRGPGVESSVSKLLGVRSRQESSELVVRLQGSALAVLEAISKNPDDPADPAGQLGADVWEQFNTRCLSIAGGTTQILRNVAGERILGLPR